MDQWARVQRRLRTRVGDMAYESWLSSLALVRIARDCVEISAPTRFMCHWVTNHYAQALEEVWHEELGSPRPIQVTVRAGDRAPSLPGSTPSVALEPPSLSPAAFAKSLSTGSKDPPNASPRAPPLETESPVLDRRCTFDTFVVGPPNELAHAAALRLAEADAVPFNPLFLYGGVGLGKTHLMHAIAWHIRSCSPQRRIIYLTAENFMYRFVRALRLRDTTTFKEQFRSVDVLMIDDLQFIGGREATQEEFFHTFNALVDNNRQVIASADKSPGDLEGVEERLRSRLGWGLVADLHPTTYELRLGILHSKCTQLGVQFSRSVLEFLAARITSSVRALEGALHRLIAEMTLRSGVVTVESVPDLLGDLLSANAPRVRVEDIQKVVAQHYNLHTFEMHSPRRARAVARPRQVAMYLAKQLTTLSLPEIGRKFGGRDHTTVMHAVRRVECLLKEDRLLAGDVDILLRSLRSG